MSGCSVAGQLASTIHEDFYCIRLYSTATSLTVGRLAISPRQLAQPSLEKPPLRFLLGETEGPFIGGSGFGCSVQSPAEIRPPRARKDIPPGCP
jgi:hypothetical protein